MAGTGRITLYEELLLGDLLIGTDGRPVVRVRQGVP